jgi:DNA-binding winged helix-turn-helix (wHTH) protein
MRAQFNDLTFDSETRQIWLGGKEARLSPKAFDLLALLIDRRPAAVSKEEIRELLWPGTFVSDSSLPTLVSEIRDAIKDQRRKPPLLRTLHGFGYAFQSERSPSLDVARDKSEEDRPTARSEAGWLIGTTVEVPLFEGENIIGREGEGIVVVKSTTISRRHARIVIDTSNCQLEDLGSKNGTYLNDRRVNEPTPIADGDRIRFGSVLLTFKKSLGSTSTETQSSRSGTRLR